MFGRAISEALTDDPAAAVTPSGTAAEGRHTLAALQQPNADSGGPVSGASPRSEARSFSERAGSDVEGDSPPAGGSDAAGIDDGNDSPARDAASTVGDRAVVSDMGEAYGLTGSDVRRPVSRAASLLERDETTEACFPSWVLHAGRRDAGPGTVALEHNPDFACASVPALTLLSVDVLPVPSPPGVP